MRLSVNVDHVATLRNARGGRFPCPVAAARLCLESGADGITVHLREDRRHIRDDDAFRIARETPARLNFEMAATEEMVAIALRLRRGHGLHACCIVPERRAELTTEGGLDVRGAGPLLREAIRRLSGEGVEVALFVEPDPEALAAARDAGAQAVELHTGAFADAAPEARPPLEARLREAARAAAALGLRVHAGHGLDFGTVGAIARLPEVEEVSIGHFLVGAALFEGLPAAVARMQAAIAAGRSAPVHAIPPRSPLR